MAKKKIPSENKDDLKTSYGKKRLEAIKNKGTYLVVDGDEIPFDRAVILATDKGISMFGDGEALEAIMTYSIVRLLGTFSANATKSIASRLLATIAASISSGHYNLDFADGIKVQHLSDEIEKAPKEDRKKIMDELLDKFKALNSDQKAKGEDKEIIDKLKDLFSDND